MNNFKGLNEWMNDYNPEEQILEPLNNTPYTIMNRLRNEAGLILTPQQYNIICEEILKEEEIDL